MIDTCDTCNGAQCGGGPSTCSNTTVNDCQDKQRYCDRVTAACKACPAGKYNCDGLNDCESAIACDKVCTSASGCNDSSKFCDLGACKPCPSGSFNCNNKDDCECKGTGCDGTSCQGATTCDYSDLNVCGGDSTKWCWQGACQACTSGYFNCNKTKGCECDSAGCNGAACAGTCSGGECP